MWLSTFWHATDSQQHIFYFYFKCKTTQSISLSKKRLLAPRYDTPFILWCRCRSACLTRTAICTRSCIYTGRASPFGMQASSCQGWPEFKKINYLDWTCSKNTRGWPSSEREREKSAAGKTETKRVFLLHGERTDGALCWAEWYIVSDEPNRSLPWSSR